MKCEGASQILIGYDAREWWLGQANSRGMEWVEQWFLRRDIVKPLSVERAAWNSVFDVLEYSEPNYKGLTGDLWEKLDGLEEHLPVEELKDKPYVIMAFSAVTEEARPEELEHCELWASYVTPSEIQPEWTFLGYEVADWSPWSVLLTTCAREDFDNREPFRQRWAPHLNRWHLFDDLQQAIALKNHNYKVLEELAPFLVYGHWLVRGVNGGGPRPSSGAGDE